MNALVPGDLCETRYHEDLYVYPTIGPKTGVWDVSGFVSLTPIFYGNPIMVVAVVSRFVYLLSPSVLGWRWSTDLKELS